jgi:hypothetical protein
MDVIRSAEAFQVYQLFVALATTFKAARTKAQSVLLRHHQPQSTNQSVKRESLKVASCFQVMPSTAPAPANAVTRVNESISEGVKA